MQADPAFDVLFSLFGIGRFYSRGGGGGGTRYITWWGGAARPLTLTLFKTNIADFPTLFRTEFRFLIPCLRRLSCLRQKLRNRYPD